MLYFDILFKFLFIWAELGSPIRLGALGFFKDEPSRKPSGGNRNPNSSTQLPLPPLFKPTEQNQSFLIASVTILLISAAATVFRLRLFDFVAS